MLNPETFQFLKDLKENNNREWFTENKPRYQAAHQDVIEFFDELIAEMKKVDNIANESGKKSLLRIYRDVRFSKDKTPYAPRLSGSLKRATKWLRGGYYVHLESGNVFLGVGFWAPESSDLKIIREELSHDAKPLREILEDAEFKSIWGEMQGEKVKSAPKGYSKDHPNIDLLRFKGFTFVKNFSDDLALSEDFLFEVVKAFIGIRPFFDYMSEVLTRHIED